MTLEMRSRNSVAVAEVVRHNGPIQITEGMPLDDAIDILERLRRQEEEEIVLSANVSTPPFDGALALKKAMDEVFGFSLQRAGFMENRSVKSIVIDSAGTTAEIPWGSFEVPGIEDGVIRCSYDFEDGMVVFQITARIKGKYRQQFHQLVEVTKRIVREESIYKGKALQVNFRDEDGDLMPVPDIKFLDVSRAVKPIFRRDIEEQIEHDLLAYVRHPDLIKGFRKSAKRGALLHGSYGGGKTLTAEYVAKVGIEHGWTYIYAQARDIERAIHMARRMGQCIVFIEDVESVAHSSRTDEVNRILETLDGIGAKGTDVITIFTTNHPEKVNDAMYRPGRIDLVLEIATPDAEASVRLARMYAGERMADEDFMPAGETMAAAQLNAARIEEVVARAIVRAISRTEGKSQIFTCEDLQEAAKWVIKEQRAKKDDGEENPMAHFGREFGREVGWQMREVAQYLQQQPYSNGDRRQEEAAMAAGANTESAHKRHATS